MSNHHHVYPVYEGQPQEHNIDGGGECWCRPTTEQACPICDGDGCPGCRKGWTDRFTDDPEWPTVTIHNDVSFAELN